MDLRVRGAAQLRSAVQIIARPVYIFFNSGPLFFFLLNSVIAHLPSGIANLCFRCFIICWLTKSGTAK